MTSLLQRLTLRQKIGQTCQIHGKDLGNRDAEALAAFFAERPVGSVFLGSEVIGPVGEAAEGLRRLISRAQGASPIPLSVAGDLENGAGGAIRGLTSFPHLLALGALDDPAAAYDYGKWTAAEACRVGFNWTFGPVVDLAFNWLNPIVSVRGLGRAPEKVAALGAALVRGCQDHGLSATAKHFPGDGVDFRDQHLCVSTNSLSRAEWERSFGLVYERCFAAGVHAVMAGHVALPWREPGTGTGRAPLPATTSRAILDGLLRERMGYDGVVVSDALIMAGFRGRGAKRADLIVEAFNAGIDVMLWPGDDYFELMERAVEEGRVSEARLDRSVARILAMKARQGLFDVGFAEEAQEQETSVPEIWTEPGAVAFARDVAERSLTLVGDRAGLLPLAATPGRRVQVLLATASDRGVEARIEPLLEALRERGLEVSLHVNGNCLDLRKREEAGETFDILLAVFDLWTHGFKNTMRPVGPLAECLWTLQGVESAKPVVVSFGSPYLLYDMPWAETYVNAYSGGPSTCRALVRALFGEIPFAGRSPVALDAEGAWDLSLGRDVPPLPPAEEPEPAPGLALASTSA